MNFNYKPFVTEFVGELKKVGKKAGGDLQWLDEALDDLSKDTEALLHDLATTDNPIHREAVIQALERTIPNRKVFILSRVEAAAGVRAMEVMDVALDIGGKLLVAMAKAFIPVL